MSKGKLYTKLLTAKQNFNKVLKDSDNPYYKSKYADLNAILSAVEPALMDQKLILLQPVEGDKVYTTIVDSETGESVSSYLLIPSSITDPQKIGAAVTYLRRFSAQSLMGLQAEDDDGNFLAGKTEKLTTTPKTAQPMTNKTSTAPTPAADTGFKRTIGAPTTSAAPKANGATPAANGSKVWD